MLFVLVMLSSPADTDCPQCSKLPLHSTSIPSVSRRDLSIMPTPSQGNSWHLSVLFIGFIYLCFHDICEEENLSELLAMPTQTLLLKVFPFGGTLQKYSNIFLVSLDLQKSTHYFLYAINVPNALDTHSPIRYHIIT